MSTPTIEIKKISLNDFEDAKKVRIAVFVHEQGVPLELEVDEYDPIAHHWVVYNNSEPVGTVRMLVVEKEFLGKHGSQAKLGRLAVLSNQRGLGLGKKLVKAMEEYLITTNDLVIDNIIMHAQEDKQSFYEKLGYIRTMPNEKAFIEDGILHVIMHKPIIKKINK